MRTDSHRSGIERRLSMRLFLATVTFWAAAQSAAIAGETIKELRRLDETIARLGGNGDNWHMSWTADDRVVTSFGDGNAEPWPKVPRRLYNSRMIAIRGVP